MLYAILCYDSEDVVCSWSAEEDAAVMQRISVITERLSREGRLGPTARLMPTTAATSVRRTKEPLVIDGPFAETKEQLLGFYTVECDTLDEAIEIAKELTAVKPTNGTFEIRPVGYYIPGVVR